ncbi:hypothetical protein V5799_004038 [Amblyomma americanum]|uniref:Sodium-dependent glucose transporter 1 n=1 Tax=Amblyomma americanum TaxID=6943 RepID=A0AAQ4D7A5_AMBAM
MRISGGKATFVVLRSTMLTSEPAAPALLKTEGSPLQIGGASVRKPIVQPPHELKKEPATPPHTTLPPVTEFEWGSPGTAKTHFKPPTGSGTRSWLSHLSSPYIATPPLAIVTPPKSAATPPRNGMKAGAEPATGKTPKSDSQPTATPSGAPTSAQQAARKSATVGDVTAAAEKPALEHKWERDRFLEHAPARKPDLEAGRRGRLVKSAQTFSIHLTFFGMGMYYAMFGPTLQDLAVTLDVDLYHALFLLAARGIGYFLGAVAGGVLLRPVNPQVLLIVLDFFLAMACLGVSYFDTLFQSQLVFGLGGFALGAINIVGVLWVSALHRDASGFLLQTLSFMHCIGCTLAPILSEPFMTRRSLLQPPSDLPPPVERELAYLTSLEDKDFIYISYAYWAVGIYVFLIIFLALVAFFVDPRHQDLRPMETQCPAVPFSGLVVVLFFYLFLAVAMEIIYSQLIAAFALLLGHNKTVAAYVTSLFWASYSTVRGVSITWLKQHGSFNVLLCSNVFLVAVTAFSSVFGYQTRVMWIGTALAAACMAPVMPSTLLLLHDHSGVSVGRFTLAVFTVGVSSAFAPLCLGAKLEREPMLFHYALAALAVLSLLLVFIGRTLVRRTPIEDGYTLLPADRRPSNRSSKLH